jgi:uncharacterized protein (TIGR03437 family)
MKKKILMMLAAAPVLFAQAQTFTYTYSGLPIPIYPDDWDTVAVATIFVPRAISITKVTATVQVQFSGVGDLNVFMWSAAGTRIRLTERNCGSLQNIDTTFDDAAQSRFGDTCPTEAGRGPFRGNEPLSNANGQIALGYWRLGVENNGSDRTGTLNSFSITITGTPVGPPAIGPNTIVSTSSFLNGTVAPGDQVAIFGANLGPAAGVRAPAGASLPTSLGGTSVTFDGVAAPILYASDRFVAVQAPALTPGSTTQVQVTATSGTSTAIPIPVVPVKPGILTYETGGKGQAKAINQDGSGNGDGSINSSHRGAAPGSVIQLFATGLGAVNPPVQPGTSAPTSPLSTVNAAVSATIGGRAAQVTYAGAAPGLIGTYQVNVIVPAGTPSGAVRVVLSGDGNSSQDDVTIQISR